MSRHINDYYKEFPSKTNNVFVLIHLSKTWNEIIGVYSSREKALDAYNAFAKNFSGTSNLDALNIIERELL